MTPNYAIARVEFGYFVNLIEIIAKWAAWLKVVLFVIFIHSLKEVIFKIAM